MSRPIGSKNEVTSLPAIIETDETERLEYLAALLIELLDEELQENEAEPCIQT